MESLTQPADVVVVPRPDAYKTCSVCQKDKLIEDRVRGLLCSHCNTGIGNLKDSPKILLAAIEYLESGSGVSNHSAVNYREGT